MPTKTEKPETVVNETEVTNDIEEPTTPRIPEVLDSNAMLADMCKQYLDVADLIAAYNNEVLKPNNSEWNRHKVLAYAKAEARPDDASKKADEDLLPLIQELENAQEALNFARDAVLKKATEKLGISLSETGGERDPEKEAPLKEKRKFATTVGSTLNTMAEMLSDKNITNAIQEFLKNNPLPNVGREQVRSFSGDNGGGSTPRYRVKVEVKKDGKTLLTEDGFTKTALALTKPVFGYDRGQAPKADKLRQAWEAVGNAPGETKQSTVNFEDNGLEFILTAK